MFDGSCPYFDRYVTITEYLFQALFGNVPFTIPWYCFLLPNTSLNLISCVKRVICPLSGLFEHCIKNILSDKMKSETKKMKMKNPE